MIVDVDRETLNAIRNADLRTYAAKYVDISEDFMAQVRASGIEIDPNDYGSETIARLDLLRQRQAIFRNSDKSIYLNQIAPACVACQKGAGSETFFISLKCHRSCFYCFNPNQEGYDHF
ncbi:MAG: radical SAM protein, partial [Chloroflexi bacterium]|nr:radical SAM protein [Chloroflexota bacterium]